MKRLLLTLLCATSAIMSIAQNFTVTGIVIDSNSDPVANHSVTIYADTNSGGFNYYNTVTTDVNGNFTDVIPNGAQIGPNIDFYVETWNNCAFGSYLQVVLSNNQGTVNSGSATFTLCASSQSNCQTYFIAQDSANTGNVYFQSTTTGSAPFSYVWDFGDGNTSTSQNPWHFYNTPGNYTACLTITDGLGCSSTFCDVVMVGNTSPNCSASFYATTNPNGTYTFYDFSNGQPTSWFWDFGDGNTSTQQNPSHNYTSTGTYTVCLTISNFACTDTYCYTINYTGQCQANFYSYEDSTNNVIYLIDLSSSPSGTMTYFWDFGDGNTSNLQYPTHVYANSGFYSVCLTITDNNFCTSTYCDTIGFTLFGGPGSHQNGFTINVIPPSSVGVEEVVNTLTDLNVYPNPANENVTLEYNATEAGNHSIILRDITGKVIINEDYNAQQGNNRLNLNLNGVELGMYLITVADASGNQSTLRITKQ